MKGALERSKYKHNECMSVFFVTGSVRAFWKNVAQLSAELILKYSS